ncbi:hypothetical protein PGB90_008473 [Kerria lacca]
MGVFGNCVVLRAIRQQKLVKNRILLNLCISDFLVCVLSGPTSVIVAVQPIWQLGTIVCKTTFFIQNVPAVASTLLLMMLSVDRYIAIQHPLMFSLIRDESKLPKIMTFCSWFFAILVCIPILLVRNVTTDHTCEEFWFNLDIRKVYVLVFISVLYAIPSLTVGLCHLSVGNRIYATSLMASAANGDIPLPMPIMARPKDMIIVASVHELPPVMLKYGRKCSTNEEFAQSIRAHIIERAESRRSRSPTTLRQMMKMKILRQNDDERQPQTSTSSYLNSQSLQSRRRLATMLMILALVFAISWLPYVSYRIYFEFAPNPDVDFMKKYLPFCLLIGHMHSAVNPIVYWFMNRQAIQMNFSLKLLLPWNWCKSKNSCLRRYIHYFRRDDDDHYSRSSTTNEAQLGAFHPRFIRPRHYDGQPYPY